MERRAFARNIEMKGIIIACVLALSAASAQAATVNLKEGGHLDGALVSATDAEVVLDTALNYFTLTGRWGFSF
jgi:hypothetical protein